MGFRKAADGVTKQGKTKGKNLGDTGPTVAIQTGKGKKGASRSEEHTSELQSH